MRDKAPFVLVDVDLARLEKLAAAMVANLPPRVMIGLRGTLGAGKTRLSQAIARAAGVDRRDVTSPTFTIVQHYEGTRRIHHIDAYRLADEDEFIELGGEEILEDDAMILVEWPERIAGCMPRETLYLDLEIQTDPNLRTITASCLDENVLRIVMSKCT